MRVGLTLILAGTAATALSAAAPKPRPAAAKPTPPPVARYEMRAETVTGFGAMSRGSMVGMMLGGKGNSNSVQHHLELRLGSSLAPTGAPKADHFMPAGAKLGLSVPLITPNAPEVVRGDGLPGQSEGRRPTGRMLIYWGCGEHAPAGQPIVIDFAKLAAGQMPAGMWSTSVVRDLGPTALNSRTIGLWPAGDNKSLKPDSSLIGAHRVAGNYSPEISFTLGKDFMGALYSSSSAMPSGASLLSWNAVPDATGYFATLFGGNGGPGGGGDIVMWSSAASRQFGGGFADYLSPGQVAGLVRDRSVMAPSTTSCAIPAEVIRAAGQFYIGSLSAYGPEEDFAYPARPAAPQWTARIRHRAMTSFVQMPGMGATQGNSPDQNKCKPSKGLGGIFGKIVKPGC